MIDLADYYSGGYFLIRNNIPGDIERITGKPLLPYPFLSLSRCFCPHVCVGWGWHTGDREAAANFGIPEAMLDEFVQWCRYAFETEIDYPSMFHSLDAARRFVERFIPNTDGLYLIEVGFHHDLAETNWYEGKGYPRYSENGITARIENKPPLADGGTALGFEVICFGHNDFLDSWHCSPPLVKEIHGLFDINPGQFGLLQTRKDAHTVRGWIEQDTEGRRPEPYPYSYWLLVSHPLQA